MSPKGFRTTADLIVNEGPLDTAAGTFTTKDSGPVLWSRQVLTSHRLTAIALIEDEADFQTTHAIAEETAAKLGIGAIDVAVCVTGPSTTTTKQHAQGWSIELTQGDLTILTTDAKISAAHLAQALPPGDTVIALASGASGVEPDLADFTALLTQEETR